VKIKQGRSRCATKAYLKKPRLSHFMTVKRNLKRLLFQNDTAVMGRCALEYRRGLEERVYQMGWFINAVTRDKAQRLNLKLA